jgi:hypothetical protein
LPAYTLDSSSGPAIYAALSRVAGTTENTLETGSSSVEQLSDFPTTFTMNQNYPNPFNPTTNFQFSIFNTQSTILKVYDMLGREVETLVNEVLYPGTYKVKWDASRYSGGIYFYHLNAGSFTDIKKMTLIK